MGGREEMPAPPWSKQEMFALDYEGEVWGANLAMFQGGETAYDSTFAWFPDEESLRAFLDEKMATPEAAVRYASCESAHYMEPGEEMQIELEHAEWSAGNVSTSEFEPYGAWHVGADGVAGYGFL